MARLRRFIVEYVGNLDSRVHEDPERRPPSTDRRTNHHTRELVDWIKRQMEARGFTPARKLEFVNDLRHALRQGDPMRGGRSDDEEARSRDAPF